MDTEYDTPGEYMDAGDLVPDEVVNAIVDEALSQADGFVLDGYPRNLEQAEELEGMTDLDVVLSLEVSRDELVGHVVFGTLPGWEETLLLTAEALGVLGAQLAPIVFGFVLSLTE